MLAVDWAAMHSTDSIDEADDRRAGTATPGIPVAGEGAPLVAEFAVTEFAAAIGLSTDAGKRVRRAGPRAPPPAPAGVAPRGARGSAARGRPAGSPTRPSSSPRRRRRSWTATSRHARTRSDRSSWNAWSSRPSPSSCPTWPRQRRLAKADGRHFTIEHRQMSFDGTSTVHGELDLVDAQDLDTRRHRGRRPAQGPRLRQTPSTCAGRSRSARSPAPSSPSTWTIGG